MTGAWSNALLSKQSQLLELKPELKPEQLELKLALSYLRDSDEMQPHKTLDFLPQPDDQALITKLASICPSNWHQKYSNRALRRLLPQIMEDSVTKHSQVMQGVNDRSHHHGREC